jgi:hypothetical protein
MKHWKAPHKGCATFAAWERIREAVLGLARSHSTEAREIEGVQVRAVYNSGHRHFVVNDKELHTGAPLATIVWEIIEAAGRPLH